MRYRSSRPRTIGLILMSCRRCSGWWCCGVDFRRGHPVPRVHGGRNDAAAVVVGDGDDGGSIAAADGPGSPSGCRQSVLRDWPPDPAATGCGPQREPVRHCSDVGIGDGGGVAGTTIGMTVPSIPLTVGLERSFSKILNFGRLRELTVVLSSERVSGVVEDMVLFRCAVLRIFLLAACTI